MVNMLKTSKIKHCLKLTLLLFLFWFLLSGKWDMFHLTIGLVAAVSITWISLPLMRLSSRDGTKVYYAFDIPLLKYIKYWTWLMKEIIKANIEVAMIILHPRMPIDPQVVTLRKKFSNPIAQTTLSNSIILTPGTLTLDVDKDVYTIHSLTKKGAERIQQQEANGLLERIDNVFSEQEQS